MHTLDSQASKRFLAFALFSQLVTVSPLKDSNLMLELRGLGYKS